MQDSRRGHGPSPSSTLSRGGVECSMGMAAKRRRPSEGGLHRGWQAWGLWSVCTGLAVSCSGRSMGEDMKSQVRGRMGEKSRLGKA